jgi:hypothetical protein
VRSAKHPAPSSRFRQTQRHFALPQIEALDMTRDAVVRRLKMDMYMGAHESENSLMLTRPEADSLDVTNFERHQVKLRLSFDL